MKTLLGAALALLLSACATRDEAPEAAAAPTGINPALFVVRDADSTMYLYGTVHVRQPGTPWGGANAQRALAASDEVWTEMEISPEVEAQMQGLVIQLGMAPADRPLSSWLSAPEQARLSALTERLGMPPGALEPMQPWLASITLSLVPMLQAGYDPQSGVDRAIDADAGAAGKTMRFFETGEQQLRFLAGLSPEAQHEMLLDAIEETEAGPEQLNALIQAWEQGDLDAIDELVVREIARDYPELFDVLFRERNDAWVEVLAQEMEGAGVDFVAVGAGHIVGDAGLVALMRARGYVVERVRPEE